MSLIVDMSIWQQLITFGNPIDKNYEGTPYNIYILYEYRIHGTNKQTLIPIPISILRKHIDLQDTLMNNESRVWWGTI